MKTRWKKEREEMEKKFEREKGEMLQYQERLMQFEKKKWQLDHEQELADAALQASKFKK
jgi:hypothetical protein